MTNEEKIDLKKEIEEQDGYEYSDELFSPARAICLTLPRAEPSSAA